MKDYYKILEVNSSASQEIISKVYKILAKKYHPDTNPDNKQEAEERFKELKEAYGVLSDTEKRVKYDIELANFKNFQNNLILLEEYENLKIYCIQLENELKTLKSIQEYTSYQQNPYVSPLNNTTQNYSNKLYANTCNTTTVNPNTQTPYTKKSNFKGITAFIFSILIVSILFCALLYISPSFKQSFYPLLSIFSN